MVIYSYTGLASEASFAMLDGCLFFSSLSPGRLEKGMHDIEIRVLLLNRIYMFRSILINYAVTQYR